MGPINVSPAIGADGTVYVGSDDHHLYAINPDGTLKWKFQTGYTVWSSPAIGSDETVYIGSNDNYLYAIGVASGPSIVVSETSLDFGSVPVGDSKELTLTVRNVGDASLSVTDITASSADFVVSPTSLTVAVESNQQVAVTFTPSSVVATGATLTIASNDTSDPAATIGLIGNYPDAVLSSIDFASLTHGWVVGDNGTILHTVDGGITWQTQDSGTKLGLNSVHFVDTENGWITGNDATILHTNNGGETWELQSSGVFMRSIEFLTREVGFAVGSGAVVLKTIDGGNTWRELWRGESYEVLSEIDFVNQNEGWIVGHWTFPAFNYMVMLHTTDGGATWQYEEGRTFALSAVDFPDENVGYAVGYGPRVFQTKNGGQSWSTKRLRESLEITQINSVFFIDTMTGWVVGDSSMIYRTTDGGESWIHQDVDASYYVDVHFVNSQIGFLAYNKGDPPSGRVLRTENGGDTWSLVLPP